MTAGVGGSHVCSPSHRCRGGGYPSAFSTDGLGCRGAASIGSYGSSRRWVQSSESSRSVAVYSLRELLTAFA